MSTTARKARKRTGIPFPVTVKEGTSFTERAWFTALLPGPRGTRHALELVPRSLKKRIRALDDRGLLPPATKHTARARALRKLGLS